MHQQRVHDKLGTTGNRINKESQYLSLESSNKTDTWYESKCLCFEQGHPHLFPWTRPIVGEPSLQVRLACRKDMHRVYCTGHTAKGMNGNWNSAQTLLAKPYVLWGAGSTWKYAPFAESIKTFCQIMNQCSCKHLEGFLILTPPKEEIVLAATVMKESKDWYLEWKKMKRQMGWKKWKGWVRESSKFKKYLRNIGSRHCTVLGGRPPKFIKSEADFIPEKEQIFTMGHTEVSAIAVITVRDQVSEIVAMGAAFGLPLTVKPSTRCGPKSFYNLDVRFEVTLHF